MWVLKWMKWVVVLEKHVNCVVLAQKKQDLGSRTDETIVEKSVDGTDFAQKNWGME